MNTLQASTILVASFVAGGVNAIAGGGTLVSFPALLGVGLTGQQANVTSTLALWPGSIGGFYGHRKDLAGTHAFALRLVPPSIAGALVGAGLMLVTPHQVFDHLIPWLILTSTLLMAANDPLSRWIQGNHGEARSRAWWTGAIAFQFLVGIYGGYFGAVIGILMLAALSMLGLKDIHQMNGLKNLFALSINGVAAIYFIFYGMVYWPDALLMAIGAIAGGIGGSGLARKLGRTAVRRIVISIGFAMAISLFFRR